MTFCVGILWRVEWGMILGTLSHLCILLYSTSKPNIVVQMEKMDGIEYVLVQPDRSLRFPSVDKIRTRISEASSLKVAQLMQWSNSSACGGGPNVGPIDLEAAVQSLPLPIVFDFHRVVDMDYSAAKAVRALAKSISSQGQSVTFCGTSQKVEDVLQGVEPSLFLSYTDVEEAVKSLTAIRQSPPLPLPQPPSS